MELYTLNNMLRSALTVLTEGSNRGVTRGNRGEIVVIVDSVSNEADRILEGSTFTIGTDYTTLSPQVNPTINASIIFGASPQVIPTAPTTPSILIHNNEAAGGKNIVLDYFERDTESIANNNPQYTIFIVDVDTTPRYVSGGTLQTPKNSLVGSAVSSIATVRDNSGATITASAPTGTRRTIIVEDLVDLGGTQRFIIPFRAAGGAREEIGLGAAIGTYCYNPAPPVIIPPGCDAMLYFINNVTTAPGSFPYTLSWTEV
jgi:hypothetical protein